MAGLFIVVVLFILFVRPLIDGVIYGLFFAYVTRPIKDYLNKIMGRYRRLAPYIATICILLPVSVAIVTAAIELRKYIGWIARNQEEAYLNINRIYESFGRPFEQYGIPEHLGGFTENIISFIGSLPYMETVSGALLFVTNLILGIIVCFFFLRDGGRFVDSIKELIPVNLRRQSDYFIDESDRVLSGLYIGSFYNALFASVVSAIIFYLFGLPSIVMLSIIIFFAVMVPILSSFVVIVPLTFYMVLVRSTFDALVFFTVCMIFIYVPPNFIVGPAIVKRTSSIHQVWILLAFVGGAISGGVTGFLLAPLLLGLLTSAYRTYMISVKSQL